MLDKLGGPGSGHWGHAGRIGKRGGSAGRAVAMSLKTGKDWETRQSLKRDWTKKSLGYERIGGGKRATMYPGDEGWDIHLVDKETKETHKGLLLDEAVKAGNSFMTGGMGEKVKEVQKQLQAEEKKLVRADRLRLTTHYPDQRSVNLEGVPHKKGVVSDQERRSDAAIRGYVKSRSRIKEIRDIPAYIRAYNNLTRAIGDGLVESFSFSVGRRRQDQFGVVDLTTGGKSATVPINTYYDYMGTLGSLRGVHG